VVLAGCDLEAAEELIQEAFAQLWRRLSAGETIASPAAWLSAAAFNRLRSRWRRLGVERRAFPRLDGLVAHDGMDWSADAAAVRDALGRLPVRQREAVVCFYWLDLSIAQTVLATGMSSGMVKNALHRARQSLADMLEEEVGIDGDR
jgi:RNA polymerase sigma-70 factor (ECF subfamily)